MAIDFPNPPLTIGQQYPYNGTTWQWNGAAWVVVGTYPPIGGYVTTFNGLTGGVTGVTVGGTNAFTSLNSFNAGISASGISVGGSIVFQNQEFIRNTTNGRMDFMPAPAGSTHYGMYMDFTSWSYGVKLGTIRASDSALNAGNFLWESPLSINPAVALNLGSDGQYNIIRTATGNQTAQFVVNCTTGQNSGAFAIVDSAGSLNANRSPGVTHANPNLYVYRSGTARANDFIRIEHDGTNGRIVSGGTTGILLEPGSGNVGVSGGITGVSRITFSSGQTASSVVTSVGGATGSISMSANSIDWSGLTSGFDILPAHWANISAPINTSPTANDAYFAPITITRRCQIKSIATQNGASSAGNTGNIIFGLYSSTLYGYPDQRLYSSSSTPLTTGNFGVLRVSNVDTILNPGLYWLAMIFSASAIPVAGLSRIGSRFKFISSTSSSPIAQASVDALRSPQGSFTLLSGLTGPFTNVVGADAPGIFYTAEGI
jgi:hypothetical protein